MQTRRHFLQTAAVATLGFPAIVRAANLNSKVQIAAVGASGKGLSDIMEVGSHSSVKYVGFADVDTSKFEQAARKYPVVPQFQDFREMFAKLGDKFDAVICSTPDHMHAIVGMQAMALGKHLYCQKPLTHTMWEARQMRLHAEKAGVITQMGNQIHSHEAYRTGVKLIQSGVIGKIKAVHSIQPKTGNHYTKLSGELPPTEPVPETMNWNLWIGPAPMREFSKGYHPAAWRDWQDFGGGVLGDFGCHIMDPVFCALKLTAPLSARAENDGINPQTWPVGETVQYVFPGTEFTAGKTLPLTWYDGGHNLPEEITNLFPKAETDAKGKSKAFGSGSIFIGEGGAMMLPHVGMPTLLGEQVAGKEIEKVPGSSHYHAWVDGILKNEKTTGGFHYAGLLTEAVHLGNIATRVPGQTIEWDPANLRIPNNEKAQKLITKNYREGWAIKPV
jgi:predicted dehydrogenase